MLKKICNNVKVAQGILFYSQSYFLHFLSCFNRETVNHLDLQLLFLKLGRGDSCFQFSTISDQTSNKRQNN